MPEAKARIIESLEPNTRLYVEERILAILDAAILFRSPLTQQDLEAIISSLAVEEDNLQADSAGVGVVIISSIAMDMPIAMAKAATTHKEVEDIKEKVGMAEELAITIRQPQPVFAVARPAIWRAVAPSTYLQRLQKN